MCQNDQEPCEVCAAGPNQECWSCEGSGWDEADFICADCGGSGEVVEDHCCTCGGSPYCVRCHTCGAECFGSCACPITVTLSDGATRTL